MTPHNEARLEDIAEAVLLPGDPDRATWIAATFLDDARRVNAIRSCFGYTGSYKGVPISIQATGMGRASFRIYVHELMAIYRVRRAIRIGTCGGLQAELGIRGLVIADQARMDFEVAKGGAPHLPNATLLGHAADRAQSLGVPHRVGAMVSSDVFYHPDPFGRFARARGEGAIACDMETSELYDMGASFGAETLSICTVSDNMATGEETALSERQTLFADMARLALETLVAAADASLPAD